MSSSEKKAQKERRDERKKKEHLSDDVLKFQKIYDDQWPEAHDALLRHRYTEKVIATVLLEIVQRAFTINRDDAYYQLRKAQVCAEQIVSNTQSVDEAQNRVEDEIAEEVREYRYLQANRAIPRARKDFCERALPLVLKKKKIAETHSSKELEEYASNCVEVTWYLCAEDPPVDMDLDDAQPFNENLFTSITKKGAKIDYVLWPALKQSKNGPVLLKGMVACST